MVEIVFKRFMVVGKYSAGLLGDLVSLSSFLVERVTAICVKASPCFRKSEGVDWP
jgi:hypothetical protein